MTNLLGMARNTMLGRYDRLSWQDSLALRFGCTSELYTQYEFLGLEKKVFEANI